MKKGLSFVMARLRALFSPRLESGNWDRVSLCSMAPMSADAFRHNEEAEHYYDNTR